MLSRISLIGLGSLLLAGITLTACDTGSVDGGGADASDLPAEALCNATINTTGTFTTSLSPAPLPTEGCVPEGTWSITATVADMGDCATVVSAPTYVVEVVGTGRDRTITLQDPPAGTEVVTGVHSGGNGECEMTLELITASATAGQFDVVLLKPYTEPGTTPILGTGSYQLWSKHP